MADEHKKDCNCKPCLYKQMMQVLNYLSGKYLRK